MMVLGTDSLLAILLTLVRELRAANPGGIHPPGDVPLFFFAKVKIIGGIPPNI